ncbi:unnamed protein product [Rhodiola kirilowii]
MDHHEDESHGVSETHDKKDSAEAIARHEEIKKSVEAKLALRKNNLNPDRPDAGFLRSLDSSIKRNTAVIKKLKQINEEQKDGLLDELRSVNLSKFVSEAVAAICEARLKSADIQAAIQICSLLHQRYKDFSQTLAQGLLKVFSHGKSVEDVESDKNMKAMKKRSTLKLLVELFFVGVIEDSSIFNNIIKDLTSAEHFRDRDTTQTNLSLLASFARQGRIFLGLPLSGHDIHEEFFKALSITAEQKKLIRKAFLAYFDAVVELLQSEHSSLRQMEHENAKVLNAKGELSDDAASSYEKLRKSYDQLYRNISSLAEVLDMQPPAMPEDSHTTRVTMGEDGSSLVAVKDSDVPEPIWDDEDTKAFYESLPDLRAFVPAVLLGEAESKVNEQPSKTQDNLNEMAPDSDQGQMTPQGASDAFPDIIDAQEGKCSERGMDKEEKQSSKEKEKLKDLDKEKIYDTGTHRKGDAEKDKTKVLEGTKLDGLLQRLPGCVSRDLIDQLTVEFCYLNSKANRKKLVRALFNVSRTSLELLPYYSRMVATLSTCVKDISSVLVQMLEEEFNFLINKKDQMNIETKIRNIRFIGELCKFKVAPPGLVFSCLKACLDDFTHHNIDVACNLLETCGRFLYRSPETSLRMANMLGTLMRLKNVKNLDPRHSTFVENAYYLCKPPERSARVSKVRPPLHQYIRKLLFTDLDKTTIDHVLRQLRKLPWDECEEYLLKCFMKVHKGKYGQIHLIALLTASLSRYHDEFGVGIVDEVLEEIRVGLELNEYGMQQRRIAHMRYLGELYNFELADSSVIFETLYLLLVFGHGTAEQDVLDPPEDFFRIRMVITLLQTCGQYFGRGSSKKKLDRFLLYFQRYIISKGVIPLDIEFDLQDLFAALRPNMTRYTSLEEVEEALVNFEESEHTSSNDRTNNDKSIDGEKRSSRSSSKAMLLNGKNDANGISENGKDHEDAGGYSGSESSIIDPAEEESDIHGSNSEDGEDDEGGPAVSDEDEAVRVRQKVVNVDPSEEAEFEQQLKSLIQESLESRRQDMRTRSTSMMMVPMSLLEGSAKDHHGRGAEGESGDDGLDEECGDNKEVQVKVLVKRGNKNQTRQMFIPRDCSLVQSSKQLEAAELEEKQDIKRLVLEYNDREEEEMSGIGGQGQGFIQPGNIRGFHRGSTWEGTGGRGGRFYYKPHHHGGNEAYYSRKR